MRPGTVLISGARAPVAVHLARLLGAAHHRVLLCDHVTAPIGAASRAITGYRTIPSFRLEPLRAAQSLRSLIADEGIEYVIPTCEEVFYLARFWESADLPARLIAPPPALLEMVHNKFRFIECVRAMGLSAPGTHLLSCRADRDRFARSARDHVFKPVWSRFASEVFIRPGPKAFETIAPTRQHPWVAQQFIAGREVSVYAVAHEGRLAGLSAYRSLIRAGKGAGVSFEPVHNAAIRSFVEVFVGQTRWTGQISFDVIVDAGGSVMPLECNPRATSGVHFFDDPEGFARAMLEGAPEVIASIEAPQGVRLAVWIYGLSGLFHRHSPAAFWRALRRTEDVLLTGSDPIGLVAQARSVLEFARIARKTGRSLQQASTYDLEWDGPDQSSISN